MLAAALTMVATMSVAGASGATSRSPLLGGTYRVGWDSGFQADGFDPTGEYDQGSFGIYSNLLLRTLVQTEHVAGTAGRKLVPDLAERVPAPTDGDTRYTFTLKRGVRFGPPVDREITAADVRYAIERVARPGDGGIYYFLYRLIKGFDAYRAGEAPSIAGIRVQGARTISFDLVRPEGDFLYLLTLPAAAPIPPEVGRCFEGRAGAYGRDLIASGPYMIEGSDAVDTGSCGALKPMRGISPTELTLVRNPSYDPRTDSRAARESNPDRFVFITQTNLGQTGIEVDLAKKVQLGELDDEYLYAWPKAIAGYLETARKKGRIRTEPADWVVFMTLNLTKPPFDDVHVRRAMNWALDRAALAATLPGAGRVAEHIVPDDLLGGRLADYAPFATPGHHGDLARARAEMSKSRYATRNGVCIAQACKRVFLSPLGYSPIYAAGSRMVPILIADAARIGITFANHFRKRDRMFSPSAGIASAPNMDLAALYPDPATFVDQLFSGADIRPDANLNFSLVGITPSRAATVGVTGDTRRVPSVDRGIASCGALSGPARLDCYAGLDRELTTEIVPWVPLIDRDRVTMLGPQVTRWAYDASTGGTAYAHVALKR
jgi:peptide/nickel transport system substrate-binding protein